MPLLGEVVAPVLPAVGIPVIVILLWCIALGMLLLVLYLTHILTWLLSNTVGHVPGVGTLIDHIASSLESTITSTLGSAIAGVDKQISFWWHTLGDIVSWTYHELRAHASLLETMATVLVGAGTIRVVSGAIGDIRKLAHAAKHLATLALAKATAVENALEHPDRGLLGKALALALAPIAGRITAVEKWIAGTGSSIAGEINTVIEPDIASLRARATTLENEALQVFRDAAGAWHAVNVDAIAAALVLALPSLGLQWLRCNSLGRFFSKTGCGLGSFLEDVLALISTLALALFAVLKPADLAEAAVLAVDEIEPLLAQMLDN